MDCRSLDIAAAAMVQSDQIRVDCIFTGEQPMCNRYLHNSTWDICQEQLATDISCMICTQTEIVGGRIG